MKKFIHSADAQETEIFEGLEGWKDVERRVTPFHNRRLSAPNSPDPRVVGPIQIDIDGWSGRLA